MSWQFGSGTGDDVELGAFVVTGLAGSRVTLVTGWFRPTTLTATRKLWSFGTGGIPGAEIDTSTSEIRLKLDGTGGGAVDGVYTTTGVGLAVDKWTFLAVLSSISDSTGVAWRVWAGALDQPPVECTVSTTTAVAGTVSGSTAFYIGNAGTGTVAFQGDIADIICLTQSATPSINTIIPHASRGTITPAEAEHICQVIICPLWRGDGFPNRHNVGTSNTTDIRAYRMRGWTLGATLQAVHRFGVGTMLTTPAASAAANFTTGVVMSHPRSPLGDDAAIINGSRPRRRR